jgi:biopolymer transport protein ExbB
MITARSLCGAFAALTFVMLLWALPVHAQQAGAPGAQVQAPSVFPPPPAATTPLPQQISPPEPAAAPSDAAPHALPAAARPERDMSPWTMFLSADILVKLVMISLTFASLVTWTIFLAKTVQLALAKRRLVTSLARVSEARTLAEAQIALGTKQGILSSFLGAAIHEVRLSADNIVEGGVKERVYSSLVEMTRIEARAMRVGLSVLATIGSTAPFVGLFGTVWGIMNSFIGISKSQTTNLAVVAPGIAEALLATAIGLVAAIPAVMIYNHFSRATKGYVDLVSRASGEVGRLLSRDLDRAQSRMLSRAAE